MTIMLRLPLLSFLTLYVAQEALATSDGFNTIQCGRDVPKTLLGKTLPNEAVRVLERRHKAIGLQDLGATDVSDHLNLISWKICGDEYMLLQDKRDVVRDVLPLPPHSKHNPEFVGTCLANGKAMSDVVVAILKTGGGSQNMAANLAWKIDEANAKIVKISEAGLSCPQSGIATVDGGP